MCRLFETIRIENGRVMHPHWHEARMSASRLELWNIKEPVNLREFIKIPELWKTGLVRCRLTYRDHPESITFENYLRKPVASLKLVECDHIDYHLKKSDRSLLDDLFSNKGICDEIIIIRDGSITDTSISNLIFFDGKNWCTPDTPLLNGTCRQRLLAEGKIIERQIRRKDIWQFSGLKLINAMRYPDEQSIIPVSSVSV